MFLTLSLKPSSLLCTTFSRTSCQVGKGVGGDQLSPSSFQLVCKPAHSNYQGEHIFFSSLQAKHPSSVYLSIFLMHVALSLWEGSEYAERAPRKTQGAELNLTLPEQLGEYQYFLCLQIWAKRSFYQCSRRCIISQDWRITRYQKPNLQIADVQESRAGLLYCFCTAP